MPHTINRTAEQFFANVEKLENGCWNWKGGRKQAKAKRYPRAVVNGIDDATHRLAYLLTKGEIPNKMLVMHGCDNPACVNPDHLSLGTNQDNSDDMVVKGRSVKGKLRPGTGPSGTRNTKAVLTPEAVKRIRDDRAATGISVRQIAAKYGISKSQAYNVISGKHWKE